MTANLDDRIRHEKERLLDAVREVRQVLDDLEHEVRQPNGVVPSLGALQFSGVRVDMLCARLALLQDMQRGR